MILAEKRSTTFLKSVRLVATVAGLSVLILVVTTTIKPAKAKAAIWPANTFYQFVMPKAPNFYKLMYCNETSHIIGGVDYGNPSKYSPTLTQWVSPLGSPATTATTVNYGQPSINLVFTTNGATCYSSGGSVDWTNLHIESVTTAGTTGLANAQLPMYFGHGSAVGTYANNTRGFTYAPPGGFTTSGTYWILVTYKQINQFPSGSVCVGNGARTSNLSDFGPCALSSARFPITVTVRPPVDRPPHFSASPSCSPYGFTVTTWDSDPGAYNIWYKITQQVPAGPTSGVITRAVPNNAAPIFIPMPAGYNTFGDKYQVIVTTQGKVPPGARAVSARSAVITVGPCSGNSLTCGTLSPSAAAVGSKPPISVTVTYTKSGPPAPLAGSFVFTVTSPGITMTAGSKTVSGTTAGTVLANYNITTALSAGVHTFTWKVTSPLGNVSGCTGTIDAINTTTPYLNVYGGDVFAGGGFSTVGGCNQTADIKTNVRGNLGSGVQFAAYVMGIIDQSGGTNFITSQSTTGGPPSSLTFANTASPLGNFGGSSCIDDNTDTGSPIPDNNVGDWGTGTFSTGGPLTLGTGVDMVIGTGNSGDQVTLYVNGDLIIKNNIKYSWTGNSLTEVPSLRVVVTGGNLYIDHSVTQLDGIFVVAPRGSTGGTIYTCTNGNTPESPSSGSYFSDCASGTGRLTVHGKLLANKIRWLRGSGDVNGPISVNDNPYSSPAPGSAEVIIDGPESYIRGGNGGSSGGVYDKVTSLPPIL